MHRSSILLLFDVDGTLTLPRQTIQTEFESFLLDVIRPKFTLGLVGGSDFSKIAEQMNGVNFVEKFDYVFPENGLIQYKNGKEIGRVNITNAISLEEIMKFEQFTLEYIEKLKLPFKRSIFVERRTGLINVSPVGRTCTIDERNEFEEFDKRHKIRMKMIEDLKKEFKHLDLNYVIGGQISFDVYPVGWDKSYCLRYVEKEQFKEIHFFGDKTHKGGNDYEIFIDKRTIGHQVKSPDDTKAELMQLLKEKRI